MLRTLGYLTFGLLMYLVFTPDAPEFSWADPWLYVWMVFWPVPVVVVIGLFLFVVVALLAGIGVFLEITNRYGSKNSRDN